MLIKWWNQLFFLFTGHYSYDILLDIIFLHSKMHLVHELIIYDMCIIQVNVIPMESKEEKS